MKVWNDCPLCQKPLVLINYHIKCGSKYDWHYCISFVDDEPAEEQFIIDQYLVYNGLNVYRESRIEIWENSANFHRVIYLDYILPFKSFNSAEKIKRLILLN